MLQLPVQAYDLWECAVIQGAQTQEQISRLSGTAEHIKIQEGMFVFLTKGSKKVETGNSW